MARKPTFPPECCGVCKFCHAQENEYFCLVQPAKIVVIAETETWTGRGAPVEPLDHICGFFQPRMHA